MANLGKRIKINRVYVTTPNVWPKELVKLNNQSSHKIQQKKNLVKHRSSTSIEYLRLNHFKYSMLICTVDSRRGHL